MEQNVQLERVIKLAKYWETVDPESVSLDTWKCGTQACLAGHATTIYEFNDQGFVMDDLYPLGPIPLYRPNNSYGLDACKDFFGSWEMFAVVSTFFETASMSDWQIAASRLRNHLYNNGIK